jgi:hypothetical protein
MNTSSSYLNLMNKFQVSFPSSINGKIHHTHGNKKIRFYFKIDDDETEYELSTNSPIQIHITGPVEKVCGTFEKVVIEGDCGSITNNKGDVIINGDVVGDVSNKNGSIETGLINGNVYNNTLTKK